jgi:transposase
VAASDRKLLPATQEFRHIATRYAKTDTSFAAALYLAAAILALR